MAWRVGVGCQCEWVEARRRQTGRTTTCLPHVPEGGAALLLLLTGEVENVGVLRVVPVRGDVVPAHTCVCGVLGE